MRTLLICAAIAAGAALAAAQLRVVKNERLNAGSGQWKGERFSPSGTYLYLTTPDHHGIWEFGLRTGKLRQITQEKGAGFGFSISPDGRQIAFLRTAGGFRERKKEVLIRHLQTGATTVAFSGSELSFPAFSRNGAAVAAGRTTIHTTAAPEGGETVLLGIDRGKILLQRGGRKIAFDPLGDGNYIWPSLSPDGTRLLAYEMRAGAFVSDLEGRVLARLGRKDAPVWTRDGRWIVYMDDRDDGDRLISSEIGCISPDGRRTAILTSTQGVHEMFPQCSPTEDRIICSTPDGELYSISYREEGK